MTSESVSPWAGARPAPWRLWAGATSTGAAVILTVVALGSTSRTLFRGSAVLSALLLLGAYGVAKPWFVARSETLHRVITFVPMTAYVVALGLVVVAAASFLPGQPVVAGLALVMIWCFHVGGGVREPTSFAYERLRGRLTWTAALQVAAMCCGTVGIVCLIRVLPVPGRYTPAVFATCLSVVVGLVVASAKVFARVRKLATELDARAQKLERCLDRLSRGSVSERGRRRDAAEDAWDELNRTLSNKVETGFHLYGTFIIPPGTRSSLETLVTEAITNPGAPPYRDAVAQLNLLRTACRPKIDTMA
ncbi:hypothetical protein OG530_13185 [Streptomyces decoyicus]|uniref:hypothetical protein n=1 Tax=Streptomyces decoyicus TaxID=249567 RepID=UPI002E19468B